MNSIMLHFDCLRAKNKGTAPLINPFLSTDVCPYWSPTLRFPWRCMRLPSYQCPCNSSRRASGGVSLVGEY